MTSATRSTTRPVTMTHVGGPTVLIEYAGLRLLTDPTFDEPGEYPRPAERGETAPAVVLRKLVGPAIPAAGLGSIDAVLLSHDQHKDNLDETGAALLGSVPVVLSTAAAAERLAAVTMVTAVEPWQVHTLAGQTPVTVTVVPASHGPQGSEAVTGPVIGFVLQADGWPTVYVAGDNASVDVTMTIGRRIGHVDIAVLFVGAANVGRFGAEPMTMDAVAVVAAWQVLGRPVVVPVHHSDWEHFVEPIAVTESLAAERGMTPWLRLLARGEAEAVVPLP